MFNVFPPIPEQYPRTSKKMRLFIGIAAVVYWLAVFLWEPRLFDTSAISSRLFTYIHMKLVLLAMLYGLFYVLYQILRGVRQHNAYFFAALVAIPYWLFAACLYMHSGFTPDGDEINIYNAAIRYENLNGMFTYITTYFYMLAMSLCPKPGVVLVFKQFLVGMGLGYCINRLRRSFHSNWAFALYGVYVIDTIWLLPIMRMPMYSALYLFYGCILLCDYEDHQKLDIIRFFVLAFITAVLTQWRPEGIYLLVFGPILMGLAYRVPMKSKLFRSILVLGILVQALVYAPQKIETTQVGPSYAPQRIRHFYNYVATNMLRNGLDREKNAEDLAIVDRCLCIEGVDRLNAAFGDDAYNDEYVLFYPEYGGLRLGAPLEDVIAYESAMLRIILRNLPIYLKSQLKAFQHITFMNLNYGIPLSRRYYYQYFTRNLYAYLTVLLAAWVIAAVKKKWLYWWFTSGLLGHSVITTALLPAAYLKYYLAQYTCAYLLLVILLCRIMNRLPHPKISFGRKSDKK